MSLLRKTGVLQQMPASCVKRAAVVKGGSAPGTSPQKPPEPLAKSFQFVPSRARRAFADLTAEPELQWSRAGMCAVSY